MILMRVVYRFNTNSLVVSLLFTYLYSVDSDHSYLISVSFVLLDCIQCIKNIELRSILIDYI